VTGLPPASYFLTSAVFHYLGPSFAVLLFAHVSVLGVAWLRIAAAAVVFALWRRPWRLLRAIPAFPHPIWLLWGIGVGVCSSVAPRCTATCAGSTSIPYVTDQFAMARLPRATFALMLAILPAAAAVIGLVILGQAPTCQDLLGICLIIIGVALHQPGAPGSSARRRVSGRRRNSGNASSAAKTATTR
jgi:threonine/homoserine efflux transporter RhtA